MIHRNRPGCLNPVNFTMMLKIIMIMMMILMLTKTSATMMMRKRFLLAFSLKSVGKFIPVNTRKECVVGLWG
jgi:hypothetical protein